MATLMNPIFRGPLLVCSLIPFLSLLKPAALGVLLLVCATTHAEAQPLLPTEASSTNLPGPYADPLPNLTAFQPPGWSDRIVLSKITGTTSDAGLILPNDALFVDWAVINSGGAATTARFHTALYVDDVLRATWYSDPPLPAGYYTYVKDYFIGSLPAGVHSIKIRNDTTFAILESDEADNEYTKTFVVKAPAPDIHISPLKLTFGGSTNGVASMTVQQHALLQTAFEKGVRLRSGSLGAQDSDGVTSGGKSGPSATLAARHVLIQFRHLPTAEEQAALRQRGLTVLRYLGDGAFWFAVAPGVSIATSAIREAGGAHLAVASGAVNKLAPEAAYERLPTAAVSADGRVNVEVLFFEDVPSAEAETVVARSGGMIASWPSDHIARVTLPYGQLPLLSASDEVEWVQPAPGPKREYNAVSAEHIHVTELRNAPYALTGDEVKVGVWDGGSVGGHTDFDNRLTLMNPTAGVSAHATHVAGTIGGSGASDLSAKGMSPSALLFSYDWDNDSSEMRSGAGMGIRLSNHSYGYLTGWEWDGTQWVDHGSAGFGVYGNTASDWDDVVYDTGIIVFKAAGNDRNNGPDAPVGPRMDGPYDSIDESGTGKNVITVGATTDTDGMTGFSSWGPVNDGRVKPDLCANGESLRSTLPGDTYGWMSGTSMATPSACGAGTLLAELYSRSYGADLRPDTCKALLVHSATDLGRTGPDYEFGWGLIHARASADLLQSRSFRLGSVANGDVQTYAISVTNSSQLLKATLAWTDPAGSPAAQTALVNDLDLYLTSPSGANVRPWVLDRINPTSAASRGTNKVDNVEQVVMSLPEAGEWTLTVQGAGIAIGPQEFTLVCEQLPAVGSASEFAIYNDGGADLAVTNMTLDAAADYISWSPAAPFVIAPGGSRTVTVVLNTNAAPGGTTTRRLVVNSNDTDENPYPGGVDIEIIKPYPPRTLVKSAIPGTLRNDFSGFVGMRFQVGPAPLIVTELGRMMTEGNTGTHLLKVVDAATGVDLPGGSVTVSMTGGVPGAFKYASLPSPLTLQSGKTYFLVCREESGNDRWQNIDSTVTTSGAGTVLGGVYNRGTPPWYHYGGAGHSYVPLDFRHANTAIPRTLEIHCSDPASPVNIALSPTDNDGLRAGVTPFSRTYDSGWSVAATAPMASGLLVFQKWQLDGADYSSSPVITITISTNHRLTAVYAKVCESPLVESRSLGTLRNDYSGFVGMRIHVGATPMHVTRLGRMMAPGNSGTHFLKLVNAAGGTDVPGSTVPLNMTGGVAGQFKYAVLPQPVTLSPGTTYYIVSSENAGNDQWYNTDSTVRTTEAAVVSGGVYGGGGGAWYGYGASNQCYGPVDLMYDAGCNPRHLTVLSINPASGATVDAIPPDNTSANGGSTPFDRFYDHDTSVTLTAPGAVAGNYFLRWQCDGADFSTNPVVSVVMNKDRVMTAIYRVGAEARFVTGIVPGTLRNNYGAFVGMRVALGPEDLTVTRLGRIMVAGNNRTHTLKIVDAATGQTVTGSSVIVNMTGGVPGEFKYATLTSPVMLKGGSTYYFVSSENTSGDLWHDVDTRLTTTAVGSVRGGIYGSGPGAWYSYGATGASFVPVDFIYGVPTPPSVPFVTGQTLGRLRNDYNAFVGMKINVGPTPIAVTELGRMMAPDNASSHLLKLVQASSGQDVPGGSVTVSMAGGVVGEFRFGALPEPVTLPAWGSYYVLSREQVSGDFWYDVDTSLSVTTVATVASGAYGSGPGAWYLYGSANQSYVPVNFRYTPALALITKTSAGRRLAAVRETGAKLVLRRRDGNLHTMTLAGVPGQRYRIEVSSDLQTWVPAAELENEIIEVQVEITAEQSQAFYRMVPMPGGEEHAP